ncbi:MAG: FAD-dependent oxidoreductase [Bifidobacteriaceae bacterium]|nr:FAD-dependent oxidoreductase [Bifidobacteriaceae bacterium]
MSTPENLDIAYDVVVIGSGGSGKSAALTAAQAGLTVVILEKLPVTGGTSVLAEGHAAFESSEQLARGAPSDPSRHFPTKEEAFRRYMDYSHYRADPEVVRMFVENSAETIDIFKDLGVEYTDVLIYALDEPNELVSFHRPEGLGARCQEVLERAARAAGVEIFTSTRATELIASESGAIIGVVAKDADGETLRIGAKAVIIATGGYGHDLEKVAKYSIFGENAANLFLQIPLENTGDGLDMAITAGADISGIGAQEAAISARGKMPDSKVGSIGLQPGLWVNREGRRFYSEEIARSFGNAGLVIGQQPGASAYAIFDAETVARLESEGSEISLGDFILYKAPMSGLTDELAAEVADGRVLRGDTVGELATALGIDPTVLIQTVETYNQAAAEGIDREFFKPAEYLRPVVAKPFYAIEVAALVIVSAGGIRVNANLQVIDHSRRPIEGLYAVGNDASGLYGDAYNLDVPGSTNGFAHTSGRVAARHVAARLRK